MRCEGDVRARLCADEAELRALGNEINRLSLRVKLGGEDWRLALETLSSCMERRRTLHAQLESLRWVLLPEADLLAG